MYYCVCKCKIYNMPNYKQLQVLLQKYIMCVTLDFTGRNPNTT